jgi:hypothetical protein
MLIVIGSFENPYCFWREIQTQLSDKVQAPQTLQMSRLDVPASLVANVAGRRFQDAVGFACASCHAFVGQKPGCCLLAGPLGRS